MKNRQTGLILFLLLGMAAVAWAAPEHNLGQGNLALKGYDPISYTSDSPVKGDPSLQIEYDGAVYLFSSEANRDRFAKDPQQFVPAYGGWCAWAMLEGDKVDVDPLTFKRIDGRLYLFYNGFWGNTLEKWNDLAQEKGEPNLVGQADQKWQEVQ